jgi:metal-sulfur cluster biosynthetic enzyme
MPTPLAKSRPPKREHPENVEIDDVSELIWHTLKTCYDPEIPVNIVDLGLVYRCELEPGGRRRCARRLIDMTLTAPGCGMGEAIANEVATRCWRLPRVGEITVNMVFDPPWDRSRMSWAPFFGSIAVEINRRKHRPSSSGALPRLPGLQACLPEHATGPAPTAGKPTETGRASANRTGGAVAADRDR